jgi:hypothetical protein
VNAVINILTVQYMANFFSNTETIRFSETLPQWSHSITVDKIQSSFNVKSCGTCRYHGALLLYSTVIYIRSTFYNIKKIHFDHTVHITFRMMLTVNTN